LIETNGLPFGSIGTSTLIAVALFESDFATAEKREQEGIRTAMDKRANDAFSERRPEIANFRRIFHDSSLKKVYQMSLQLTLTVSTFKVTGALEK
jgi:hypothetical protein